ncbi:hypothetical protein F2P56_007339 [Juglans regia]|uniref:Retrotransposon Copia-like N-terminal domain-containing protein n=1 Tax=Juglans regia TaxID=51240 RepID=A0A833XS66_JUGRE|nr:hypothetical protein F2P56_007339 [Juglans regia]
MVVSTNSSSISDNTPTTLPIFNPSSSINISKLTRTNFPTWKATMLPFLKGQKVFGYVDGTLKMPAKEISSNDGTLQPNPAFDLWETQDNLILSCINASLTDEILMQVSQCSTSHEVWTSLHTAFATQSKAKVIQVRSQLATARKTTQSVTDYFMYVKKLSDDLAMAGQAIHCDEIITYLLAGLGPEYDSLITTISVKEHVSLEEVFSMLLTCEALMQHHQQALLTPIPAANVATKQYPFGSHGRGNNSSFRNRGRGQSSSHGRGNFQSATRSHNYTNIWCQLCDKPGHIAARCFKRFDNQFLPQPPRPNHQANIASNQTI